MNVFGMSDKGRIRPENQDTFAYRLLDGDVLAVVCDGMGGEASGSVASDMACTRFISFMEAAVASGRDHIAESLRTAADAANRKVFQRAAEDVDCSGMGTTLVAVYLTRGSATLLNVGDSSAYRICGGKLIKLTHDHSVVQEMVDRGQLTQAQARKHPRKNLITRAIGGESIVRSDVFESDVRGGDIFLLCSDGLTNTLDEETILCCCKDGSDPESICRSLILAALERGARDNVTVVAVTVEREAACFGE